jgi:hypothetical protein
VAVGVLVGGGWRVPVNVPEKRHDQVPLIEFPSAVASPLKVSAPHDVTVPVPENTPVNRAIVPVAVRDPAEVQVPAHAISVPVWVISTLQVSLAPPERIMVQSPEISTGSANGVGVAVGVGVIVGVNVFVGVGVAVGVAVGVGVGVHVGPGKPQGGVGVGVGGGSWKT